MMKNQEILLREQAERETYRKVGGDGRSALDDEELLLPESTFVRYRVIANGGLVKFPLEQMIAWAAPLEEKRVLEICCHDGEYGTILAKLGAHVDAVDIAEPLIEQARRRAELNGVSDRFHPQVMSVHEMKFPDETFDVVFGKASLHHLDLRAARDEVRRVLKPGGVGIFAEPIVFSPLLRTLRPLTPVSISRESPDERQFTPEDIAEFCRPFASHRLAYFRLLNRLDRLVPALSHPLAAVDARLLRALPGMKQWSGNCTFMVVR